MNKKRKLVISLSLLFLFSANLGNLGNLHADNTVAEHWGYGAIGCGAATALSIGGFVYNFLQREKNKALLQKNKKLTPKKLEKILNSVKNNEKWLF